jgi:hypothetical protein
MPRSTPNSLGGNAGISRESHGRDPRHRIEGNQSGCLTVAVRIGRRQKGEHEIVTFAFRPEPRSISYRFGVPKFAFHVNSSGVTGSMKSQHTAPVA